MALTATLSTAAKAALANRAAGGSSLFQPKYVVFVDGAATPLRFRADTTAVTAAANVATSVGSGTCPAGVTTPLGYAGGGAPPVDGSTQNAIVYLIGDVGTYHIDSAEDATTLAAGAWATFANYIIATVVTGAVGDRLTVTPGDGVKCTALTLTF